VQHDLSGLCEYTTGGQQIADQAEAQGIPPENGVRHVLLVHQARKEFVAVEELAALAVFLSFDAAASMTATAVTMDNEWTQH
jgi:3-hydroxybutyrate dehydrogenase